MPGFTGVGAGEWRLPSPAPPAGAVGGFYLSTEDNGGYHRRGDGTWSLFSSPFGVTTSPYDWIDTIAVAGDDAETCYAFTVGLSSCHVSHDGGATWASHALPMSGEGKNYRGAASPQAGHVYLSVDDGTISRIYKSTDDGVTWTQIVDLAAIGDQWGRMSIGTTKLWFAAGNGAGGVPWFHQCNLDGSGLVSVGPTTANDFAHPQLSVLTDDLVLGCSPYWNAAYLLTPTGYTDITPAGHLGNIAWCEPLTPTVFLCTTDNFGAIPHTSPLYRSDDAGASWTLIRNFGLTEGFCRNYAPDNYPIISHDRAVPGTAFLLGDAAFNNQQIVWVSTDLGLTWTEERNAAEVLNGDGDWPVFGPGGIYAGGSTGPTPGIGGG
jgi:hypothetical protein